MYQLAGPNGESGLAPLSPSGLFGVGGPKHKEVVMGVTTARRRIAREKELKRIAQAEAKAKEMNGSEGQEEDERPRTRPMQRGNQEGKLRTVEHQARKRNRG